MNVRCATDGDLASVVDMSRRVQDALTAAGSLQEFGPIPAPVVAEHIAAGTAYVLEDGVRPLGGVFAGPVTAREQKMLTGWGMDGSTRPIWFLEKLMIEPAEQGHRLGDLLLAGVKQLAASHPAHPAIVLDCWAGNEPLRAFYTRTGFRLHGVFPAGSYEVAVLVWSDDREGVGR